MKWGFIGENSCILGRINSKNMLNHQAGETKVFIFVRHIINFIEILKFIQKSQSRVKTHPKLHYPHVENRIYLFVPKQRPGYFRKSCWESLHVMVQLKKIKSCLLREPQYCCRSESEKSQNECLLSFAMIQGMLC